MMSVLFFSLLISAWGLLDVNALPVNYLSSSIVKEVRPAEPRRDYSQLSVGVDITADSAAAVDFSTGKYLYSKAIDKQLPIASITKLMTALVFLEHNPGWDSLVILQPADEVYRAKYVYRGEQVTVKDLFYTSLVGSDNNAARSLARATGLSEEDFIKAMMLKATELGMANTVFVDPTGLSPDNVSTVEDLIKLTLTAFKQPEILAATSLHQYYLSVKNTGQRRRVISTNKLLDSFLTVEAGKTGFIDEAGYCLVSKIRDDGHSIIVIVLGSEEEVDRFQESKALAWWVFNNYIWPQA